MQDKTRHKTRHRGVYYRLDARGRRRYIVWYEGSDGKGRTETLPIGTSEREALEYRSSLLSRMSKGERVAPTNDRFEPFATAWLAEQDVHLKPKTLTTYAWGLAHVCESPIGRMKVSEIDVDRVARLVASLKRSGMAPASIHNVLTPLSRVLAHAVRKGLLSQNPVRGLERHERPGSTPRKMRILDRAEIQALLAVVPKRYRLAITTSIFTGMRIGELLELRWAQVDFGAGLIHVLNGKTNAAARSIVMMPSLASMLLEHRLTTQHGADYDRVFPSSTGAELGRRNLVRRGLEKGLEDAGLEHCRMHDLRHTFASLLIAESQDVVFVCDQLGHADPSITLKVYAKLFDGTRRRDEAREKLEASFGEVLAS